MLRESGRPRLGYILFHSETAKRDAAQAFARSEFAHELVAAAVGQANVANEQIEILCARLFHRLRGRMGERDLITAALEHHFHPKTGIMMIVDHENPPLSGCISSLFFGDGGTFLLRPVAGVDRSRNGLQL